MSFYYRIFRSLSLLRFFLLRPVFFLLDITSFGKIILWIDALILCFIYVRHACASIITTVVIVVAVVAVPFLLLRLSSFLLCVLWGIYTRPIITKWNTKQNIFKMWAHTWHIQYSLIISDKHQWRTAYQIRLFLYLIEIKKKRVSRFTNHNL